MTESCQLLVNSTLESFLTISKIGTYVIEVDEFGNTWLKLTSQDAPVEVIKLCPLCEKKTKHMAEAMS